MENVGDLQSRQKERNRKMLRVESISIIQHGTHARTSSSALARLPSLQATMLSFSAMLMK